jgi:putative PEP-CTERM system histidine kinase
MPNSLNLLGYSLAFLAYIFLLVLLVFSWRGRIMSSILIAATAISAAWAFLIARSVISEGLAVFIPMVELLKVAAWCFFLVKVIDLKPDEGEEATPPIWTRRFYWFFSFCVVLLALVPLVVKFLGVPQLMEMSADLNPAVWISITIFGMVLVEQVFSTTSTSGRWSSKYLCLGLGGVFAYDFAMYADAMLFKHLDPNLWSARGLINTLAVPLIAVSIARNPRWELGIHVSRHMVFQSVTLLGAGIYLMLMATAGYLIRFYGGVWGGVLQIFFLAATGVLLVILLFSGTIRAKIRVYLSKHFFSYKYDYREEWSNFTRTLSKINDDIPEQVIASVASLVSSPGGLLWAASDNGDYQLIANWNMPPPAIHPGGSFSSLVEFSRERDWVIDFEEYQSNPDKYGGLKLPDWLRGGP